MSVGSYQTPQILELSGIGNKELLDKHGIETLIDLPGVGENLREFSVASKHILPFIDSSSRGDCPSCLQPCCLGLADRKQDHMYVPIVSERAPSAPGPCRASASAAPAIVSRAGERAGLARRRPLFERAHASHAWGWR